MKTKKLLPVFLLLFLLGFGALTILNLPGDARIWSTYENRFLDAAPKLTLADCICGEGFEKNENYLSDHLAFREKLLKLWTRINLLCGKSIINGVVPTENALLPEPLYKNPDDPEIALAAERIASRLGMIARQVESYGGTFLYVHVPEQRSVLRNLYPKWMGNDGSYLDACSDALLCELEKQNVSVLDATELLNQKDYYYKTDHHYNLYGADRVYEAICEQPEIRNRGVVYHAPAIFEEDRIFFGTYFRELFGQSPIKEALSIYTPDVPYTRYDNAKESTLPLFDLSQSAVFAPYTAYMGGDVGETVLMTNREELPNCLLVGDSFTNPLETLLYQSFNETRSLDFRHNSSKTLSDYLAENQPQVVIVVRDNVSCLDETGNGSLQ